MMIFVIMLSLVFAGCTDTTKDTTNNGTTDENGGSDNGSNGLTSLIGHWKFDENSGTKANDSALSYDGTIHGATWVDRKKGSALYFDGVDDYISLSYNAINSLGSLTQGTIAFWFKFESLLDTQTIMPIIYVGNEDKNDQDSIFIIEIGHSDTDEETLTFDPDNKKLYVTWTDLTQNTDPVLCFDSNQNLTENTWYHFTLVVGPSGNTGYLDGVELTNRYYNFGTSSDQKFLADIPVKEQFTIGYGKTHHQISPDFMYYKGYLDDLRIYNEPLSESDIQDII